MAVFDGNASLAFADPDLFVTAVATVALHFNLI
jgi:hypothetical protein